ncbi:hypothetical protein GLS40_10760 [Pseudooceanicola sp. 216_PA32_1]|uniref:Uncharacterized protein n=2 Tax=Pseudooceanicola pacificus TaxID=2676438 RepID=A0A844W3W1_9RHOB|nr:hypothetical protein [Pseudooceanicola pacificus]
MSVRQRSLSGNKARNPRVVHRRGCSTSSIGKASKPSSELGSKKPPSWSPPREARLEEVRRMISAIDPTVQAFLGFLEQEAASDPQRLRPFGGHIVQRAADLVEDVEIDLLAPFEED